MLSLFSQFIFGSSSLFSSSNRNNNGPNHDPNGGSNTSLPPWSMSSSSLSASNPTSSSSAAAAAAASSWKDKSLCFDLRRSNLEVNNGEQLIACFFPIEDIKGNADQLGLLKVTNLRLIWISCIKKRVNLSIGWRTVTLAFEQNVKDTSGAASTNLCVMTKYESTKYEFVFNRIQHNLTNGAAFDADGSNQLFQMNNQQDWEALSHLKKMVTNKVLSVHQLTSIYLLDPFMVVFKVWQAYKQTHLFRHCRANLGHSLFSKESNNNKNRDQSKEKQATKITMPVLNDINKLPNEVILEIYHGIVQLESPSQTSYSNSKSIKYCGTLILTNVRIVWVDEVLQLRNFSVPYIRIESVKLKQSERILINTLDYLATSNQIELRVQRSTTNNSVGGTINPSVHNSDLIKRTKLIFEQLQNLYALFRSKPKFGPESCEDCINYMTYLKPIDFYFNCLDYNHLALKLPGSFGGENQNRTYMIDLDMKNQVIQVGGGIMESSKASKLIEEEEEEMEKKEQELSNYGARLKNYLNEQPVNCDEELIFSYELGLMIERPANNLDLKRIWHIELC